MKNIKDSKYITYKKMSKSSFLIAKIIKKHNQEFIKREMEEVKELLDYIKGYPLDYEQRLAVVTEEKNNLIVAGAGSGKTLTIIGKVRYLVERKKIDPEQILCISFTNDATNNLKTAIKKHYGYDIEVTTFHKLALQILYKTSGKVKIADDSILIKCVENYIKNLDFHKKEYKKWICQHFFHILNQKDLKNVKQMATFPHIYELLKEEPAFILWKQVIITFIHLMKANNKSRFMKKWINKSKYMYLIKTEGTIQLKIIEDIYNKYEQFLKINNLVDFDDMVIKAEKQVKKMTYLPYKYIIIDEYQDTSFTRYCLIKAIQTKTNAILIAVGDDFQSIYRFTGCDLDIFLNFKRFFGQYALLKIQNTYRNSQELIDVAGSFIMKNKKQMKKRLKSQKREEKPIIIYKYKNFIETFLFTLNQIKETKIFVLGRNNKDKNMFLCDKRFKTEDGKIIYYEDKVIEYHTVHTSKGLEADVVIIINLDNSKLGFPSQMEASPILRYVQSSKEYYPYEEERRLFYVALTRTKSKVYLLAPKENPSIFVEEILKDYKDKIIYQDMI